MRYLDPAAPKADACLIELRCLASHGAPAHVTVVPPSLHPNHEPIVFFGERGQPGETSAGELKRAILHTAVAALLGRHAPAEGARHDFFLALAGVLVRAQWEQEHARQLVRAIYRVIWHEAAWLDKAEREVDDTYRNYRAGKHTTGWPSLVKLVKEPRVLEQLYDDSWRALPPPGTLPSEAPPPSPDAPPEEPDFEPDFEPGPEPPPHQKKQQPKAPTKLPRWNEVDPLRAKGIQKPRALVKRWIPRPGLMLVVSFPKVGKTLLCSQLAFCVATGETFLDQFETEQGPVLFVEWDDLQGEATLQKLLEVSRVGQKCHRDFFYAELPAEPLTLDDPLFLVWLRQKIRETNAKLVILDSYTELRGIRSKSGDIVKVENNDMRMLDQLAIDTDCTILLIHHGSKTSANLPTDLQGAGTFGIGIGPDGQIHLARVPDLPSGDPARHIHISSRRLGQHELIVRFRADTMDWDLILEGPASAHYAHLLQLHREYPGETASFTPKQILQDLGWSRATTYRVLFALTQAEVLAKEGQTWRWNPKFYDKKFL
jgi:hypothetical protein